jgi:outer membrane protein OmpA-like peptidoglycan-associated protein
MSNGSLLDALGGLVTPDVVANVSRLLGENGASTSKALTAVLPAVLGGVTRYTGTHGEAALGDLLRGPGASASLLDELPRMLGGGAATDDLLGAGAKLAGTLFGSNAGALAGALGSFAGIKPQSATSLMNVAAPIVLGFLGKQSAARGLGSAGLASLLMSQKDTIARALPAGLGSLVGLQAAAPTPAPAYREEKKGNRWLLPALALGAVALLGLLSARGCSREAAQVAEQTRATAAGAASAVGAALSQVKLPDGGVLELLPGSFNYSLAEFLQGGSASDLPKTFVFDNLNFETGGAALTPESVPTVESLARLLKAYPAVTVELGGHTDATGDAAANQKLSLDRANAIRDRLVASGIEAARLATAGYGQDRPLAANDTEDGRAKNRRTELTVVAK